MGYPPGSDPSSRTRSTDRRRCPRYFGLPMSLGHRRSTDSAISKRSVPVANTLCFVPDDEAPGLLAVARNVSGSLDVVIDDGSHRVDHQIASFEVLFPLLSDHGIYVVEDTGGAVGDEGFIVGSPWSPMCMTRRPPWNCWQAGSISSPWIMAFGKNSSHIRSDRSV